MEKFNAEHFLNDVERDMRTAFEEATHWALYISDIKSYFEAVGQCQYIRGLINGYIATANSMDDTVRADVLCGWIDEWAEKVEKIEAIIKVMKPAF